MGKIKKTYKYYELYLCICKKNKLFKIKIMKRSTNILLLAVTLFTSIMSFVSCEKAEKEKLPEATIELTLGEIEKDAVNFRITTTNASEMAYKLTEGVVETMPAAEEILTEENTLPASSGKDFREEGLKANTLYTILAVAKNADNVFTEIQKSEFTTNQLCSFEITITESLPNQIKANVECSDNEIKFVTLAYPAQDVASLDDDKTNEFIINDLKANNPDKELKDILANLYRTDFVKATYTDLTPDTDYQVLAYVIGEDGSRMTNITRADCKTTAVNKSDITFDIQTEYSDSWGTITITPSDLEEKYIYVFAPTSEAPEGVATPEDYANAYVEENKEKLDMGNGMVTGVQKYEGELIPETSYYVMAFAYEYGITSEIKFVEFTTPERPTGPEENRYEVTFISYEGTNVKVHVKPTMDNFYYVVSALRENTETEINFMKEQTIAKFKDRWGAGPLPIEECGYIGEQDAEGWFYQKAGTSYHIMVFGIWIGEDNKYHYTEYEHILENAFMTPDEFETEIGEVQTEQIPDGTTGSKTIFKVDVTVTPQKDYIWYYVEAVPAEGYSSDVLTERKAAMQEYFQDENNRLDGESSTADVVHRLCNKGIATVTLSEDRGVVEGNTDYNILIYQVTEYGVINKNGLATVIEKAFKTPIIPK